jgi:hypothetical protein
MKFKIHLLITYLLLCISCNKVTNPQLIPHLAISDNKRFLVTDNGDPFFWLGDTGWLLFSKLSREEAAQYLDDRRQKGFNVIQVMVLHDVMKEVNFYGDSAIVNHSADMPLVTDGSSPDDPLQYDFWDHTDYIIDLAAQRGIYMALVPVWGSNVRSGKVTIDQAGRYIKWLSDRYKEKPNVIWLNGGDVKGSDSTAIWNMIGTTLRTNTSQQLISYHPFGRTQSSEWFHNAEWLDFNMFQSGHRRYDQDTSGLSYGEDNWKYMADDYSKTPVKPSLDGEPSYESIPQGLHDPTQPYWTDSDVRRYAYWSVFAGGCGFTYGHNAIMQFNKPGDKSPAYGVREFWNEALNAPGASQMIHLKNLMLTRSYTDRVPSQEIIAGNQGEKYDYIAATKGADYAYIYTYSGRDINIDCSRLNWTKFKASWYNPRNGESTPSGTFNCEGEILFDPPGEKANENDWVLVLEKK